MKPVASGVEGHLASSKGQLRILVTAIALAVTACFAGYWEFEQVDSGSLGGYVAIDKTSDGTIWLAYVNRDSAIRLAHKDSVWEYDDLDTAMVRPNFGDWQHPPFSFAIGSGDMVGVVGSGRLAEHRDSIWSSEALPMAMGDACLSYDSACRPSLTFSDSLWNVCLGVRTDSGWDTTVVCFIQHSGPAYFSLTPPGWRLQGNCAFLEENDWGELIYQYSVGLLRRDSGIWKGYTLAGGLDGSGCVFAVLVDGNDSIHTFWSAGDNYTTNKLVCDAVRLDDWTAIAAASLDDSGRMQCTWVHDDVLKYALAHEPAIEVGGGSIVWCDITTDALSQPVIAYCTSDGSIYVAHGVDVAALSDVPRGPAVRSSRRMPTVVTGVLFLPAGGDGQTAKDELLDATGRKALDLHAGANDVSALPSGVYFVRAVSGKLSAVGCHKVVIQR